MLPINALASGKLQVEPSYFFKQQEYGGQAGLSIYENIFGPVYYNQWTGGGMRPRLMDDSVKWFASKQDLDVVLGRVTVSPGYKVEYNSVEAMEMTELEHSVHLRLTYKLW